MARDGYDVTLLEKNNGLGGRAGSWEKDGFRFDTGPSWYLMPEVFDHFYRLLGSSAEEQLELLKLDPAYRVYFEGLHDSSGKREQPAVVDVTSDRETNLELFESIEPGSRKPMEKYLDSAKEAYHLAKLRFLYNTFERKASLVRGDVLARAPRLIRLLRETLSQFAARHVSSNRLQQILGYPAVFLGASPFNTPSIYHLMSYLDLEDGVLYPQGGFARVIATIAELAKAEGVTVLQGSPVTKILVDDSTGRKPRVRGVEYRGPKNRQIEIEADVVVSAADLHFSETQLLPEKLQTYPQSWWTERIAGPSAVLMYLGVSGEVPQLKHHTLFFTEDWQDNFGRIFGNPSSVPNPASFYVCKPSASDADVAPAGDTNIFVLVPVPADVSLGKGGLAGKGGKTVEAIADAAIAQIATWADIPDFAKRITLRRTIGPEDFAEDLNAWNGTALGPSHVLSQSAFYRAGNVSTKVDGLYYAGGSTIPGIGLPMCLISAELVIKRLRGDVSTEPLPEPLFPTVDR